MVTDRGKVSVMRAGICGIGLHVWTISNISQRREALAVPS